MKQIDITNKNKDLDLRRFGKGIYTKAEKSGGSDGGGSDGGGSESGSNNDVFFVPATIQPKYFVNSDDAEPIEIKNYTPSEYTDFLYNKEDIISLGVEEGALNSLPQVTIREAYNDADLQSSAKRLSVNKEVFKNITVLQAMEKEDGPINSSVYIYSSNVDEQYVVYKISDDIFIILENWVDSGGSGGSMPN